MPNLLVVEDDQILADGIAAALRHNEYEVDVVSDGVIADETLKTKNFDLILLDLTLPSMDGSEVLRRLRERKCDTSVLVLTARATLEDRVFGLDAGADDYVTKPFDLDELEARIRALLRRNSRDFNERTNQEINLDVSTHTVSVGNKMVSLSRREFALMQSLMKRLNKVVKRTEILELLCNSEMELGENALEVYVHRLRRKLDFPGMDLKTLRGLGYMLSYSK